MDETIESLKAEIQSLKAKLDSQAAQAAIDLAVLKESHRPTSADALDEAWREGFRRGVAERGGASEVLGLSWDGDILDYL